MNQQRIDVDGLKLACQVRGAGPTIVLVHGFPFDHTMWSAQIESLNREFRVVAPDLRGFGGSEIHDADVANGVTMQRYADDVAATLDQIGVAEPVVLAGFSMGGYVALQFALRHAERLKGLVLCDTRAAADAPEARQGRLRMAEAVLAAGSAEPALGMIEKLLAAATMASRPEIVAHLQSMVLAASPSAIAAAQRGMACRPDVRDKLAALDVPALVVVGASDQISPPGEMAEIAAKLPGAALVTIDRAGHMTSVENPAAVTSALEAFARPLR